MSPEVKAQIQHLFVNLWKHFASEQIKSGSFKRDYIAAVQPTEEGEFVGARLDPENTKAYMWEQGFGGNPARIGDPRAYDMKPIFLAAARRKGKAYFDVKMDKTKEQLMKHIDSIVNDPLDVNNKKHKLAVKELKKLDKDPYKYDALRITKVGSRAPEGLVPKIKEEHKTDPLQGTFRTEATYNESNKQTAPNYRLFRRVSENSAPWIHPPVEAHHLAKDLKETSEYKEVLRAAKHLLFEDWRKNRHHA